MRYLKYTAVFFFTFSVLFLLSFFHNQAFAAWEIVPGANNGSNSTIFSNPSAVANVSSTDVWMVGSYYPSSSSPLTPLFEHWNGTSWSNVPSADIGTLS